MNNCLRIVIGADHRGYAIKEWLLKNFSIKSKAVSWMDVGAASDKRSDYPEFAIAAARAINAGDADCGILLCGTGVGMAIAANRFAGIYAGVSWNVEIARRSKEEDNVNILVFPADYISVQEANDMVNVWLTAEFKQGHYQKRIDMINDI
jgi:ribose 5-phosphate isomerase B